MAFSEEINELITAHANRENEGKVGRPVSVGDHHGHYYTKGGVVTVELLNKVNGVRPRKSTQIGALPPEVVAKQLLSELARGL